ncbi:MAG: DMT family transporter [Desulfobacteraceae bacterium]
MSNRNRSPMRMDRRAVLGLLAGALMISFSGVWVKISHVSPTASAFYRVLIGGIFLLSGVAWKHEMRRLTLRQAGLLTLCGALFSLDLIFYHHSVIYVGPGLGTILPNFQVFIMALAGFLLYKERLRPAYLISIPLAVAGLFLVVGIHWDRLAVQYRTGIYFGLAASVCYAGFLLSLRKLQSNLRQASFFYVLMIVSLITAAFIGMEMMRTGDTFAVPDLQSLLSLSALGLFSQAVGWLLISHGLPHLRISLSGLILLLQPALSFLWDVIFFSRPTSGLNWMGVVIVLGAIYLGTLGARVRAD